MYYFKNYNRSCVFFYLYPAPQHSYSWWFYGFLPPLSETTAMLYIVVGILVQFSSFYLQLKFGMNEWFWIPLQIIVGILYLAVLLLFGSVYMS
jgi:hypothetical protein